MKRSARSFPLGKLACFISVLLLVCLPWQLSAQSAVPSTSAGPPRLFNVQVEPSVPLFGEAFLLRFTLRISAGDMLFLPDTLLPSEHSESLGLGSWTTEEGPADSVDIRATYPVVAFREGQATLPNLEVSLIRATAEGLAAVRQTSQLPVDPDGRTEAYLLRLGLISIGHLLPVDESTAPIEPRPPHDVLGGEWNALILLSAFLFVTLGLSLVGLIAHGRRTSPSLAPVASANRVPPREEALRELDRIRLLGWEGGGGLAEFYGLSSDTLRRFAERMNPEWSLALTSNELVRQLHGGITSGSVALERLAPAMTAAESMKFGKEPLEDVSPVEAHWQAIRDWIQHYPEPDPA